MKKLFILLACVSVLLSCVDNDDKKKSEKVFFNEPIVNFGASKTEIKNQEKKPLLDENQTGIMYQGSGHYIFYGFENDKLIGSAIILPLTTDMAELKTFLSSRYSYVGESDKTLFWELKSRNLVIGVEVEVLGVYVMYVDISSVMTNRIAPQHNVELPNKAATEKIEAAIHQLMQ